MSIPNKTTETSFAHVTPLAGSAVAPRKPYEPHTSAESSVSSPEAISIIVPVYNVRNYVADCIRSLTIAVTSFHSQYGLDAEIIVVDDGSTDGSGDIVESLAHVATIRIFHTDNNGLASARNFGVNQAHSEYVSFVDGDDMVSPDYLCTLYAGMITANASANRLHDKALVIGTYATVPENADLQQAIALTDSPTTPTLESAVHVMTSSNAIRRTLAGVVPIQAVAKLARRDWYVQHPYAARHLYEDLETIIPLLSSVDTVVLISTPIYCYRQRPGSITRNAHPSMKQLQDYCHAIDTFERECATRCNTASERDLLAYQIATQCTRLHRTIRIASRAGGGLSTQERDTLRTLDAQTDARVRSLLPAALQAPGTSRSGCIRIRLFCLSRLLYDMAFDCYEALAKR
ncbi:glycosyl transferase [Bifidobacterium hapali]|uniref:Glycosyl transferase n=1 Tax=Bifidobacterium hapali TaxID=1630172 RepID=A0A261G0D2_9BIFI|nr:glycosyltransferase family 2 protein [Bifidobacterium hapali]OZG64902.1 glycosyl transferase [Bifidobacterium hapali]